MLDKIKSKIRDMYKSGFRIRRVVCCAMLCMAGCGMTNEEIVKEKNFCTDNGMYPAILVNIITGQVYNITCMPDK